MNAKYISEHKIEHVPQNYSDETIVISNLPDSPIWMARLGYYPLTPAAVVPEGKTIDWDNNTYELNKRSETKTEKKWRWIKQSITPDGTIIPGHWEEYEVETLVDTSYISVTWAYKDVPVIPRVIPRVATRLQIIEACKKVNEDLYLVLRGFYESNKDFHFYWNSVNDLDRDHPQFQGFVLEFGITEQQLDDIFGAIE